MKIRSLLRARGPFVMLLVILALVYIGFQLIVDLGWMSAEDLIRDVKGIVWTVLLVIVLAIVFSVAMIWWSARQRNLAAGHWRNMPQSDEQDEATGVRAETDNKGADRAPIERGPESHEE